MYYILYSEEYCKFIPEINNYQGTKTISFRKGYFLFNPDNHEGYSFWILEKSIVFEESTFLINKNLTFEDYTKAEHTFLKLKIKECIDSDFYFFMPNTFQEYINKYEALKGTNPELFI